MQYVMFPLLVNELYLNVFLPELAVSYTPTQIVHQSHEHSGSVQPPPGGSLHKHPKMAGDLLGCLPSHCWKENEPHYNRPTCQIMSSRDQLGRVPQVSFLHWPLYPWESRSQNLMDRSLGATVGFNTMSETEKHILLLAMKTWAHST